MKGKEEKRELLTDRATAYIIGTYILVSVLA